MKKASRASHPNTFIDSWSTLFHHFHATLNPTILTLAVSHNYLGCLNQSGNKAHTLHLIFKPLNLLLTPPTIFFSWQLKIGHMCLELPTFGFG